MLGKIIELLPTTQKYVSFNISFEDIMSNDFRGNVRTKHIE